MGLTASNARLGIKTVRYSFKVRQAARKNLAQRSVENKPLKMA
jgi:hypothetical protein